MSYKEHFGNCWSLSSATCQIIAFIYKDNSDFIYRINETKDIHKDTILVTLDVKSLYTNIPNLEGIETVKSVLNCYESYQIFVLTTNTEQFCIQWNSLSAKNRMCYENNCAPNYANIFMRKFEKAYIYPYIHSFSNFSCQFIDDIMFLWNEAPYNFKNSLRSSIIATIKFS